MIENELEDAHRQQMLCTVGSSHMYVSQTSKHGVLIVQYDQLTHSQLLLSTRLRCVPKVTSVVLVLVANKVSLNLLMVRSCHQLKILDA